MSEPQDGIDIPDDAAVAFTDGGVGRRGSGCGMVFIHRGTARLQGMPLPGNDDTWDAEVAAVVMAIDRALGLGLRRLRLLIDRHGLAMVVQGFVPPEHKERENLVRECLAKAASAGLHVTARMVQGHAETADLPSRLNDLAHIVSDLSTKVPFGEDHAVTPRWLDEMAAWDRRLKPTRTPQRWAFQFPRRRCAHFLGVDVETVDALHQAGYLELGGKGITRTSVAKVYETAQRMRFDAYFGFGAPEGVEGRWDDEISRGWDGRPSKFYHRKSGLRPPPDEVAADIEGSDDVPAPLASHGSGTPECPETVAHP